MHIPPQKTIFNLTCITIGGNHIKYPGNGGTKTASLDILKLVINSVISRKGAKYVTFDISNFYLQTSLDRPKYVRINLRDIPQEFIDEYNLTKHVHDGWVYFEIIRSVYGLPELGILANNLPGKCLVNKRY